MAALVPPKAASPARPAVVPPKPGNANPAVAAAAKPVAPVAPVASALVAAPTAPPVTAGAQVTTSTPSATPAPVAAPVPDPAGAAPAAKPEKTLYPGVVAYGEDGAVIYDTVKEGVVESLVPRRVKLTEVPTDYDPTKHVRLTKHDFANKRTLFLFMAAEAERMAKVYRAKAEGVKVESPEKQAKRREKLLAQLRALALVMGTTPEALLKAQAGATESGAEAGATESAPAT
jgi:hypothetical protein